jgi:hypothetical protein
VPAVRDAVRRPHVFSAGAHAWPLLQTPNPIPTPPLHAPRAMPLAPDVDLGAVAAATPGFTGAELAAVCREAALAAIREVRVKGDGGRGWGGGGVLVRLPRPTSSQQLGDRQGCKAGTGVACSHHLRPFSAPSAHVPLPLAPLLSSFARVLPQLALPLRAGRRRQCCGSPPLCQRAGLRQASFDPGGTRCLCSLDAAEALAESLGHSGD